MRVIGYARVSSAEQALGTSLRDQQEAIAAYAQARGLKVSRFYVEAESAVHEKAERRLQIQTLLRDIRKGDLVLCDKLDRWSRDPEFTYRSVREILAKGAAFYAVGDQCDPSTPEGDTMLGFRVLFAREEHKRIKQRMVGTRNVLRDRGYYASGTPPLGYRRSLGKGQKGLEKNILVIVPEAAERVREVFRLYVDGMSMSQVGDELGIKLYEVKRILSRRTYLGEVRNSKGEWIRGHHEPIVDERTWAAAQERIVSRRRSGSGTSETSTWILRDIAYCALCGGKMGAAYAGPRSARRYYYRCVSSCRSAGNRANTGTFVPVREVEAEFSEMVIGRLRELRAEFGVTKGRSPRSPAGTSDLRVNLAKRRERLLRQHELGAIGDDELRLGMSRLDAERARLDALDLEPAPVDPKLKRRVLADLEALAKAWDVARPAARRKVVNWLALTAHLAAGARPVPTWRTVDEILHKPPLH